MSSNSAKASIALVEVLNDPTAPGQNTIIKAVNSILDRTGINAPEEKQTIREQNIFILPAKDVSMPFDHRNLVEDD